MLQYKAGFRFVDGGVHAQVLDFPAVITCGDDLDEARRLLALALVDVTESYLELGQSLPIADPQATNGDMDLEEPIFLHRKVSTAVDENPAGVVP